MTTPQPPTALQEADPQWLDELEMATWLPLIRLTHVLPQALDRQLRNEVGISHTYYSMLTTLSSQPEATLSMGELARLTCTSPSRLTNAIAALEKRGWVRRRPCAEDRRIQYATLTDEGQAKLDEIAPGHVAEVRRLVFDRLDRVQVDQLRQIGLALVADLDEDDQPAGTEPAAR